VTRLLGDVYKTAQKLDVEVDVWEQSLFARFLDTDRDGQYLRWRYLGTDAQMLSRELLAELSKESLAAYANEQFTSPDTWIRRDVVDEIRRQRLSDRQLVVVVGESGYEKSAVSHQVLAEHIDSDGVGFWVPATTAVESLTLEEADSWPPLLSALGPRSDGLA